jgi:dihydroorotate dehydrogenase (fumarate)
MTDLTTTYLGLRLRTPLIASASPLTGRLDTLAALEDAGASAVVLPSLFEEEVEADAWQLHDLLEGGANSFAEAAGFFPDFEFGDTGPQGHIKLLCAAKDMLRIPVIASVNGVTPGGWTRYAEQLTDAGADAIELNLYAVAADSHRSGVRVEEDYLKVIELVRGHIDVPLAVKLSPFFSATAHFARRAAAAGADALVLFNRFYQPDLDLDTRGVRPRLELSQPAELRLPLRWLAIIRSQLPSVGLAATTGVHSGFDAAKALLAGADAVMMASVLLRHGPRYLSRIEAELSAWLTQQDYQTVGQARGSVSRLGAPDPAAYERANYLRTLASYRTPGS